MKRVALVVVFSFILAGCGSDSSSAADILNQVKDGNIKEAIKVALPEEIKSKSSPAMEYIEGAINATIEQNKTTNTSKVIKDIEILSQDNSENNTQITIKIKSENSHIDGDKIRLQRDSSGEWQIVK